MNHQLYALRDHLARRIGARILAAFGLTVGLALLAALVSLSATRDATARLESLQETQRRMVTAVKELELGAELQSDALQAYLLSGDQRYLADQAHGQERFAAAFETLTELTEADLGLERLDDIHRARERFEAAASSDLALFRQGWQRSATFLWRTEGQDSKAELEKRIVAYRDWYEAVVLADVAAARERGHLALLLAVSLIVLAAAAGLFIGLRLSRSLTSRLGTLAAAAGAIARDDLTARAVVAGEDEVAALAGAMNNMAAHLEESQQALEESRQKLRASLEQYRLVTESAMDVVYALDLSGRYTYVNARIERAAGYKPEELIGRHFAEFLPAEIRATNTAAFERRMRGEDIGSTSEVEFLARGGRRVPFELRLAAIVSDGQIVGLQGIARDVTRRRAMEAQIRRLAEQEHRRAEQLQEVARVGQSIARLASLDELLPNVALLLHQVFGYERVLIFLVDPESRQASLRASAGAFAESVPLLFSIREDQGLVGWVAAYGEPLRVGDVRQDPRYVEVPAAAGTLSELAVPIRSAGQVLGVLDVESVELDRFDANDEATLMILADQIATAIQNARLFEQQHSLAVAEERNRLAREIHDTLAQGLTAITLQLEVADALLDGGPELVRPKIAKALDLTRANLDEARRSVMDLRAAPLQERTLPAALEDLVRGFGRDQRVRADFAARDVGGRLPAALEAGLYRIVQEALHNVGKHARASRVQVLLEREEGELVVTIEDDGAGFDPDAPRPDRRKGGFGLIGMQERAKLLGGQLAVTSAPASGTRVVVRVPAPNRREAAAAAGKG